MSRTIDVLERMQQDRELFRVPPITKATSAVVSAPDRRPLFTMWRHSLARKS